MASAGPYRTVVSYGRSGEETADAPIGAGDATFTVNGHTFVVGNRIWISKSDGTGKQYVGPVLSKETNTITVTYGANESKGSNAKVWKATQSAAFSVDANDRWQRTRQTGTRPQVSRGGTVWSVNEADGVEVLRLGFGPGMAADYKTWRDFLVTYRDDGAKSFALSYWDWQDAAGKVAEARIAGADLTMEVRQGSAPTIGRWEVGVFVVAWDSYVDS